MTGDKYRIVKGYKVFDLDVPADEPMDEPSERQLYGWLRSRGYSDHEAGKIVEEVDAKGELEITLP
jgi:hypothetical protein